MRYIDFRKKIEKWTIKFGVFMRKKYQLQIYILDKKENDESYTPFFILLLEVQ